MAFLLVCWWRSQDGYSVTCFSPEHGCWSRSSSEESENSASARSKTSRIRTCARSSRKSCSGRLHSRAAFFLARTLRCNGSMFRNVWKDMFPAVTMIVGGELPIKTSSASIVSHTGHIVAITADSSLESYRPSCVHEPMHVGSHTASVLRQLGCIIIICPVPTMAVHTSTTTQSWKASTYMEPISFLTG